MSKVTILITAAAGTSSNATARHLLALADHSKYRILVGARSDTKIKDLIQKGAEYVQFDFNDKKRVEEGLKGVDYLWVTIPNPSKDGPVINMPHLIADFMDQVKQSDVKQIVFGTIDSSIVDPNHKYIMPSEFRLVENKIRSLNIPATYIHMGWFQENVVTYHAEELKDRVYVEPIGNSMYNQVSVEDIGEAAATVLLNPKDHVGKTYGITGPNALGGEELAKILSEVLQRPIQFVNPSPEEMEKVLLTMMPPQLATAALQLYEIIRLGLMAQVSDDYTKLTGKQYTTIEDRYKQLKASGLLQ